MDTTTVRAQVPAGLLLQVESLVEDGWFEDVNDVIVDALRRYVEARRPELMESYIWQDVEWGLHGQN
jgi:Arc/MetJ-type ribon-helix-helix transcriptional regulator